MTTQQKFTEKEIYRHLIHMTVSPKPMRTDQNTIQKEKVYTTMFRDAQVMDHAIEHSIRRANKIILRESEDEGFCFSNQFLREDKNRKTHESQASTKAEDLKLNQALSKKIEGHINHIDKLLKGGRPKTATNKGTKSQPIIRRLGNLVPLRATIEQKYGIIEKIRQHKDLSRKIKDMTKSCTKEVGESGIKSQSYTCFYL